MHLVGWILASPIFAIIAQSTAHRATSALPVVIWHGLGDRYDADGLASVGELLKQVYPGTHVYNIRLSNDSNKDQQATFLGNLDAQVAQVCNDLSSNPNLIHPAVGTETRTARFDALGFSQGGQFLRGLVERCPGISVRSLVTFGSQHNGIDQFSKCGTWDLLCKATVAVAKGNAYSSWAQTNVVPAQYYRETDPSTGLGSESYLNASHFLADINNERQDKTEAYKRRIESLRHFAMYVFENDTTVVPKESGWFDEVIEPKDDEERRVIPLRQRALYTEDWLGLRTLDERGALYFRTVKGVNHMQLSEELLVTAFEDFFGPDDKVASNEGARWSWRGPQAIMT